MNFREIFSKFKFDIIIDNNLKSYSCCQKSFEYMFENFVNVLDKDGIFISNKNGMNWVKKLKPKISFNLKKGTRVLTTFFLNKGNSGPEKGIIGV